jgi:hypothetical protein
VASGGEDTVPVTPAELLARILDAADRTGDLDWSLVREDLEIHDHELFDSSLHRGRAGWQIWTRDSRVLTVHRLRARGRSSGVLLERTDAQLWTFSGDRLVRMDYYPGFRVQKHSWARPGAGERRPAL